MAFRYFESNYRDIWAVLTNGIYIQSCISCVQQMKSILHTDEWNSKINSELPDLCYMFNFKLLGVFLHRKSIWEIFTYGTYTISASIFKAYLCVQHNIPSIFWFSYLVFFRSIFLKIGIIHSMKIMLYFLGALSAQQRRQFLQRNKLKAKPNAYPVTGGRLIYHFLF